MRVCASESHRDIRRPPINISYYYFFFISRNDTYHYCVFTTVILYISVVIQYRIMYTSAWSENRCVLLLFFFPIVMFFCAI